MSFSYAFKRVVRSWRLFTALLLGVVLASTFFAGINIGADTTAKQAIDQQLSQIPVDITVEFMEGMYGETPTSPMQKYGLSADNATKVANLISGSGIEGVVSSEVISRIYWRPQVYGDISPDVYRFYSDVVGITDDSRVYDGLTVKSGSSSLEANETYVWVDSRNAAAWKLGDIISVNIEVPFEDGSINWMPLNLTVTGFVELDKKASMIALGEYWGTYGILWAEREYVYKENLLITDWNKTFANLIDSIFDIAPQYNRIHTNILVFLDRESLIGPWDIATSISKVSTVTSQINNKILSYGVLHVFDYLGSRLSGYQMQSQIMPLRFLIPALPVFFIAWYLGTTVSDVSLNLRRKEIGLLLTKGFSRNQLLRMFLAEATLIGFIGGLMGVGLSLVLSPFFVKAGGGEWFSGPLVVGIETVILTVIFSVIITFLSMFIPARRASRLETVEALKEYRYVEEVKPFKQRWSWIAFILGAYKIILWLLGINLYAFATGYTLGGNFLIAFLNSVWIMFSEVLLGYIGPILFFWGLTKLLIRWSLKFQELTMKAARFLGDLGSLATKNARRNPARVASMAFLIALIIGYSFQVTGTYGSERDYTLRQIKFNVGADISVTLTTLVNASQTMSQIEGLSDVSSTVLEYSFHSETEGIYEWGTSRVLSELLEFRAVDPEEWLTTAFYEGELFTGNDVATAFQQMATDNDTIILDRRLASSLDLGLNDTIALIFGEAETRSLRIVGFLGAKSHEVSEGDLPFYATPVYAYVPEGLYYLVKDNVYAEGKILVKLASRADGKAVGDQIREFEDNNIGTVYSIVEELEEWQSDVRLSGPLNVQFLGVAFAVVAASIGTGLVTLVSLKERSKEVSIMNIRGLSFKQLSIMLLTENLGVVSFAVLLGAVVGLISVYGSVAATNNTPGYMAGPISILLHHVVFPVDMLLTLFACFVLVFTSTIIPIIIMLRRYVSRFERIVRE